MKRLRRKTLLVSVLVLLTLFAVAPLISLPVNAEKSEVETADVQPAAVTIFSENWESGPGPWTFADLTSASGYDYWSGTTYRAHSGSWSLWCAQIGTQSVATTIFSENFEGGEGAWPGSWIVGDSNPSSGLDYWGISIKSHHTGSCSAWCNDYPDPAATSYDYNMDAYMYKTVDLTGYATVTLSYWCYFSCERDHDYLCVRYRVGTTWTNTLQHSGSSMGWGQRNVTIPTTANAVGFYFHSDNINNIGFGAYVDDVILWGTNQANWRLHKYDLNMGAMAYRPVSLSDYSSVTLSYWYWLNCEPNYDYLNVFYIVGTTWYNIDPHTGNSGGWVYSSVTIPTTANVVGFYFLSNYMNAGYEGAYIDDIVLTGTGGYSVTINAYCYTESAYISRPITMDGVYTGWGTPHTFTGLSGTHTFTVPSTDAMGHAFNKWSTGLTSTTITVSSAGTYTAYYQATTVNTVLDFTFTPNPVAPDTTVTLSGTLKTVGGSAVYPAQVTVEYSTDGGATWHYAWTLTTNAAGQFSKAFTAPRAGTYKVRVSYAGSATYNPSSHTETLTVTAATPPTVEIWTDKATYARGETLKAYIQAFNPGPAVDVIVNCWFGLPGGSTYMYETFYTGTIPASYTSPVYTWKSFTVPTSAAVGTYSVNAEVRNPTTNALIDSDISYFTIT